LPRAPELKEDSEPEHQTVNRQHESGVILETETNLILATKDRRTLEARNQRFTPRSNQLSCKRQWSAAVMASKKKGKGDFGRTSLPFSALAYAAAKSTISWSTIGEPMPDATSYPVPDEKPTDEPTSWSLPTVMSWKSVA